MGQVKIGTDENGTIGKWIGWKVRRVENEMAGKWNEWKIND